MTLDGKLLRGLFEHERLKPAVIRTNQGNVTNLSKLKQVNVFWIITTVMKIMMMRLIMPNY